MASIELQQIAHQYPSTSGEMPSYALNPLQQCWQDGGAYALLGPSGCGKTTLLNIISGLLQPSEGRVLFDNTDVTALSPEQRNIAQVFQFPVVYDTLSVADNLAFPLRNRGLGKAEIAARVKTVLDMLGLSARANVKARNLNADDKQKISLGRGLVRTDVNAILFDEPLTVIDPHLKWQLRTELKKIHQQFGHTMIYVTHDQTEALTFADKVIVMLAGSIVQIGTPQELFEHPAHTFVGRFIGSPGMNILPCEVQGTQILVGGSPVATTALTCAGLPGLELGVRPEFVTFSETGGVAATVTGIEDTGRHRIVRALVNDTKICGILREGESLPAAPRVLLDPARIKLYQHSHLLAGQVP
jgi:glycerol transport system ATP-binding protein